MFNKGKVKSTEITATEAQLRVLYKDHPELLRVCVVRPKNDADILANYMKSKLWRMNNLYKIKDRNGHTVTFRMNLAQHKVFLAWIEHRRLNILKSRQYGISTFWLIMFFDDALTIKNLDVGLMALGKEGTSKLLDRVKFSWDRLDPYFVKTLCGCSRVLDTDNKNTIKFTNGSTIYIATSFRSATLHRLHISELAAIAEAKPMDARGVMTGSVVTVHEEGTVVIESTAKGDNMHKKLWDMNVEMDAKRKAAGRPYATLEFKPVFLGWLEDPKNVDPVYQEDTHESIAYFAEKLAIGLDASREQKNFWILRKSTMSLEEIKEEFPADPEDAFSGSIKGTFWRAKYLDYPVKLGRERSNLYDPLLPIYAAMDIGLNDYNVIAFFQLNKTDRSIRYIYENVTQDIGIDGHCETILDFEKQYKKLELLVLPHDGEVREKSNAKTRVWFFNQGGVSKIKVLDKEALMPGIREVRDSIERTFLDVDNCPELRKSFLNFSRKYDKTLDRYLDIPKKDEFEDAASAIRYAVAYSRSTIFVSKVKAVVKRPKQMNTMGLGSFGIA